jgi:hypothetical protein
MVRDVMKLIEAREDKVEDMEPLAAPGPWCVGGGLLHRGSLVKILNPLFGLKQSFVSI